MPNRIIKSLNCRKIILIFCILEVDFAISVITLFVVFNKSFQKASVNKSICVKDIVHLIVLSSTKNPLFDAYFNRVTAFFAGLLLPVMGANLTSFALFAVRFLPVMGANLTSFALFAVRFLPVMGANLTSFALFADLLLPVMGANLTSLALFAVRFSFIMRANLTSLTLFALIFLLVMFA